MSKHGRIYNTSKIINVTIIYTAVTKFKSDM